jgi:hypothetical protein
VRNASRLRTQHPELAGELDALITDATMWKRAEPSAQSREARALLEAKLREIEALR